MSTVQVMREKFSDAEWALVRHVPVDAFLMVALSDGDLDKEELASFGGEIVHAEGLFNPLHREVALDIRGGHLEEELKFQLAESASEMTARVGRTKTMLQTKLTPRRVPELHRQRLHHGSEGCSGGRRRRLARPQGQGQRQGEEGTGGVCPRLRTRREATRPVPERLAQKTLGVAQITTTSPQEQVP